MNHPQPNEYHAFYQGYMDQVQGSDIIASLKKQLTQFPDFLTNIPIEKHFYRYAFGKWSIQEVLGHLIDTERIISYRALRFSRGDQTPLAGFDENDYVAAAGFDLLDWDQLKEDWVNVRQATISLVSQINPEQHTLSGTANGVPMSTRAAFAMIAGHTIHHENIIRERYM